MENTLKSIFFRKSPKHLIVMVGISIASHNLYAAEKPTEPAFDRSLLWGGSLKNLDLSKFQTGTSLPEGIYSIDVSMNEAPHGRRDVSIVKKDDTGENSPCITRELLLELGVRPNSLPKENDVTADKCINLSKSIKNAFYSFDSNSLSLKISIPQIDMEQNQLGSTPPSSWNAGIPAFLFDYTSNAYYIQNNNSTNSSAYLSAKIGLNLGEWQFRNRTSVNWSNTDGHTIVPIQNYISHDLDSLQSQLIIGDSFTDADLFTSVPIRGIRIGSDDRMKPINDTGYAPVVRGMANSNARVVIRQNGFVISETTVAPGAFEIRDLAPASYNGDLEVTITEADGKNYTYTVPFSAVSRSLREGADRHSFSLGKVRQLSNTQPLLGQITYQRGLSNLVTINSGLTASDGYLSTEIGSVFNTSAGAIGIDITSSRTNIGDVLMNGQSYRVSFNKLFQKTGTNVTLAAYRYSTANFMDIQTALTTRDQYSLISSPTMMLTDFPRLRSRGEVNISQSFDNGSSLYINGSTQDYWGGQNSNTQFQVGGRQGYKWGSIGLDASRQKN